jgi:uncharacterized phage-like protein YoqJ
MIIGGTGHRPTKLGGYGQNEFNKLVYIALDFLKKERPNKVISGMALGWDQALAQAAITIEIPLVAAIPFVGQESRWWKESIKRYEYLLSKAESTNISSPGYSPESFQIRNEWMVDNSDTMLAMWDGSKGGTYNCIQYAKSKKVPIINLWEEWRKI